MMELLPTAACDLAVPPPGWTPERMARFLALLADNGNVRACAAACGLSAQSVYKLRRRDELFARAWAAAVLLARDHSEQVLAERALEGVEEPIYYKGELVGTRRRYDTRLLLAHLARLDRLADDAAAGEDAGRFDELVAQVAGEEPPEALAGEDPCLPAPLADHVGRAVKAARKAKDAELPYERSNAGHRTRTAQIDAACDLAHAEAASAWSAWFDRACARVDGIDPFRLRTVSTVSTAAMAAGTG